MKQFLIICLILFPVVAAAGEERDWKLIKDKNDIKVFRAHSDESRLKSAKSVSQFELQNLHSFIGLLLDETSYPKWGHMVTDASLNIENGGKSGDLYLESMLPWPVKDRHTKTDYKITQRQDYSILFELKKSNVELLNKKGFIWAPETFGYIELVPIPNTHTVKVTTEVFMDPGGYIPPLFVNLISDDVAYFTALKMRRYLKGEKYRQYSSSLIKERSWVKN